MAVSRRSAQATAGKGLAQGPYVTARAGVAPTTLRLKVIDSTKAPSRPTICNVCMCVLCIRTCCIRQCVPYCVFDMYLYMCIPTHNSYAFMSVYCRAYTCRCAFICISICHLCVSMFAYACVYVRTTSIS